MADFDSFNYDIESRLPEWWKGFGALEPINKYTQELIAEILQGLLTTMGVIQPLNCWLTIPEEYTWYHHYKSTDDYLVDKNGDKIITNKAVATIFAGDNEIHAIIPNTKRNCHARIQLKLLGTDVIKENGSINEETGALISEDEEIKELIIENAGQIITLNDIKTTSIIEIDTRTKEILVDGVSKSNLINGKIDKIKPIIKNEKYEVPYIDDTTYNPIKIINSSDISYIDQEYFLKDEEIERNEIYQIFKINNNSEEILNIEINDIEIDGETNFPIYHCTFYDDDKMKGIGIGDIKVIGNPVSDIVRYKNIDLEDENKKTDIVLKSSKTVDFDLQVYLYKPTYTTEQNIKIASVSAFPIEWVRLYGYFCHPFNNKSGYKFLWEKTYSEESRTVYDRITKQFDCERFFIQVKFHGIGVPLTKGFPQDFNETNQAFRPNPNLDKWGKIYGLPRRVYRTDITEDEEPYTFPKYYKYPIEQDYWYEERMVNEYRIEDDSVNSMFVRDSEFNNIGILECIYPFMNDIWVYTETIDPTTDTLQKVQNDEGMDFIPLSYVVQDDESLGVDWDKPYKLINNPIYIKLNPKSDDVKKLNDYSYQAKKLKIGFNLNDFDDFTPKNITIKGIELKFKTIVDAQPNTIRLGENSSFLISYPYPNSDTNYISEKLEIVRDDYTWLKENGYFTIGGEDNLFLEKEITREQLFKGNEGRVEFELEFINENSFLEADLYLENVFLNIYYEVIKSDYSIDVNFDKKVLDINETNPLINMDIFIKNEGKIEVNDKEIFIIVPPELEIAGGYKSYLFNLEVGEECDPINVQIIPKEIDGEIKTGLYDILVFCEDKVFSNEILIKGNRN